MSHLSPERLAALLDEQPTAAELSHLAGCSACSRERGAYVALFDLTTSGPAIGQPLTTWGALAPALKRDGVIDTGRRIGNRTVMSRGWAQAAAAVLLVVSGAVAGRMSVGPSLSQSDVTAAIVTDNAIPEFQDVAEAQRFAARSQDVYQASLAYIAIHDTTGRSMATPASIKTRLATLDRVSEIVGAAREEVPYDSVINGIYLNAQRYRQASIRQLNTSSMRLTSY